MSESPHPPVQRTGPGHPAVPTELCFLGPGHMGGGTLPPALPLCSPGSGSGGKVGRRAAEHDPWAQNQESARSEKAAELCFV